MTSFSSIKSQYSSVPDDIVDDCSWFEAGESRIKHHFNFVD
jgi:hypothetical protein